jgi:Tetratricopeptide repeat
VTSTIPRSFSSKSIPRLITCARTHGHATGRTQEALKLREETLQLQKAKLGPDHPNTLTSMNNLAVSYEAVGRTREGLKLREETLQLQKAKLGPDHRSYLIPWDMWDGKPDDEGIIVGANGPAAGNRRPARAA